MKLETVMKLACFENVLLEVASIVSLQLSRSLSTSLSVPRSKDLVKPTSEAVSDRVKSPSLSGRQAEN